jgi:quercetin dioxygenase-like cupin family protein
MTTTSPDAALHLLDLEALGADLLADARQRPAGRAATTLTPGGGGLKQVVMALVAGHVLQDHRAPGAATLQLVTGSVRLTWGGSSQIVLAGEWVAIPDAVHGVTAVEDAVALLTVGLDSR